MYSLLEMYTYWFRITKENAKFCRISLSSSPTSTPVVFPSCCYSLLAFPTSIFSSFLSSFFFVLMTGCPSQLSRTSTNFTLYLPPSTNNSFRQLCPPRLGQIGRNHLVFFVSAGLWTWDVMVLNPLHWPLGHTPRRSAHSSLFLHFFMYSLFCA